MTPVSETLPTAPSAHAPPAEHVVDWTERSKRSARLHRLDESQAALDAARRVRNALEVAGPWTVQVEFARQTLPRAIGDAEADTFAYLAREAFERHEAGHPMRLRHIETRLGEPVVAGLPHTVIAGP